MSYVVENISTKEVNTKFGPKPTYTVVANGDRYSYGFKKPAFKIGDEIDFQFSEDTYGKKIDHASVRMLKKSDGTAPPVTATTAPTRAGFTPAAKVFPIPPLHGDRAIVRQNSVTNATKLVSDVLIWQCKNKGDVDINDAAQLIIRIAREFEAYSCGDLDVAVAEEMVKDENN